MWFVDCFSQLVMCYFGGKLDSWEIRIALSVARCPPQCRRSRDDCSLPLPSSLPSPPLSLPPSLPHSLFPSLSSTHLPPSTFPSLSLPPPLSPPQVSYLEMSNGMRNGRKGSPGIPSSPSKNSDFPLRWGVYTMDILCFTGVYWGSYTVCKVLSCM